MATPKEFPVLETSVLAVGDVEPGESRYSVCHEGGGDRVAAIDPDPNAYHFTKLFAAAPALYTAAWWVSRAATMKGPVGTTVYIISDDHIKALRDAVAAAEGK
jgi:hypothetical protein